MKKLTVILILLMPISLFGQHYILKNSQNKHVIYNNRYVTKYIPDTTTIDTLYILDCDTPLDCNTKLKCTAMIDDYLIKKDEILFKHEEILIV